MVHGYTAEGKKIGQTLPLHVRTARTPPQMNVVRDPLFINATTIEIVFSQPINESTVDVTVSNPKNKKILTLASKKTSSEDMRILTLILKTPIEMGLPYEIILKKIVSLDGVELPPENRIPMKLVYQGELPAGISGIVPSPLPVIPPQTVEPEKIFAEPVPIDALPKTGP